MSVSSLAALTYSLLLIADQNLLKSCEEGLVGFRGEVVFMIWEYLELDVVPDVREGSGDDGGLDDGGGGWNRHVLCFGPGVCGGKPCCAMSVQRRLR